MGKKIINTIVFFIICCNVFAYEFNRSEYYVKEESTGAGDGSSWQDAMGAQTFAVALSKQSTIKEGVTFHLAAGTYHPEYDPFVDEHKNYTDNEKARLKTYYISKPINIIGGYSASPNEGDKPNPSLYPTIICGDILGNDSWTERTVNKDDNLYYLFCIDLKEKKQCSFYGLTFRKNVARKESDDGAIKIGGYLGVSEIGTILKIDRCQFEYLSKAFSGASDKTDEILVSNSTFNQISYLNIFSYKASFNSCTFDDNDYISFYPRRLIIQNCTFYENNFSLSAYDTILFHNNTVVVEKKEGTSNIFDNEDPDVSVSLIGNIFDCTLNYYRNGYSKLDSKYNLYKKINEQMNPYISSTDYISTTINEIFENFGEIFLGNNYGYTKTVKLVRDRLPGGKSIHFDLAETTVSTDQRGVKRFDYTCMGAYEKRDTVITSETHTIIVNDEFYGKKYTKIGIYDSVPVILPNTVACDSVTLHKLYVIPNDKRTTFYVKTDGTGDGSSWNNAMSPRDFAFRLYLSQSVDTFHVAAGTYRPFKMDNVRTFYRFMPVCIIGGYPENSSNLSQKPDPVRYKTIFSIDYNGDNSLDPQYNFRDDSYAVFTYNPTKQGKSLIEGIVFVGGQSTRDGMNAQCSITEDNGAKIGEFNIRQCEFKYSLAKGIRFGSVGILNVDNCYFNKVEAPVYYKEGTININACTFENIRCDFPALDGRTISVSNCTMYDCDRLYLSINGSPFSEIKFSNNTIYSPSAVTTLYLNSSSTNNLYLTGNIIQGCINMDELKNLHSKYNVFLQSDEHEQPFENNYFVNDFSSFLENQLLHVENVVTPVMVMTSDTLSDGTSLRFPIAETSVTTDQRNVNRIRMTCFGSYEAECRKDSSYLAVTDTINAGEIYMGKRITTEGLNYGIDTLYNVMGCDSLIFHPVFVLPENAIPTAFTPFDSNNKNDVFMQGHEVYIYDIYGSLICHSSNGWNGKLNDENANAGIYVYAVKMYSGEIRKGTVELLLPQ